MELEEGVEILRNSGWLCGVPVEFQSPRRPCSTSTPTPACRSARPRAARALEVFDAYLDADLRICTGNIEYHYFAGFSGGAKAVVPGMCSSATIRDNHAMMLDPAARAGLLEGNPVRDDIDEAGGRSASTSSSTSCSTRTNA